MNDTSFESFVFGDEGPAGSGPYRPRVRTKPAKADPAPDPVLLLGWAPISTQRTSSAYMSVADALRANDTWPLHHNDSDIRVTYAGWRLTEEMHYGGEATVNVLVMRQGRPRLATFRYNSRDRRVVGAPRAGGRTRADRIRAMDRRREDETSNLAEYVRHAPYDDRYMPHCEWVAYTIEPNRQVLVAWSDGVVSLANRNRDAWGSPMPGLRFVGDLQGYDRDGFDSGGMGRDGFNREGRNYEGYDRNGLDREGFDQQGRHADGRHRDDCRCNECSVAGYHETPRDWMLPPEWDKRILFGVENELNARTSKARREAIKALPRRGTAPMFLIAERDGSLGELGVEFVGPPLPLEYYLPKQRKARDNPWTGYIPLIASGTNVPNNEHGMHINISRNPILEWDKSHGSKWERRFLDTINCARNLVCHVAGRKANQWAKFQALAGNRYQTRDKYRVANVKDNVIEVRIFKASTDLARIRANVQFCYALLQWTKQGRRAYGNGCDSRIVGWIRKHPKRFPDLIPMLDTFTPSPAGEPREKRAKATPGVRPVVRPVANAPMPPPGGYDRFWRSETACAPDDGCAQCDEQRAIRAQRPDLATT